MGEVIHPLVTLAPASALLFLLRPCKHLRESIRFSEMLVISASRTFCVFRCAAAPLREYLPGLLLFSTPAHTCSIGTLFHFLSPSRFA
jgi:hypothetical protein